MTSSAYATLLRIFSSPANRAPRRESYRLSSDFREFLLDSGVVLRHCWDLPDSERLDVDMPNGRIFSVARRTAEPTTMQEMLAELLSRTKGR